jgi:putative oxidoreductase
VPSTLTRVTQLQKNLDSPEMRAKSLDVALLIIRLALAWVFIYNGGGKLFGWFNHGGIHAYAVFFANTAHLHPGTLFAVLSGVTEFVGGIAMALGLLARLVGVALFGDMLIAMITVTFANGLEGSSLGDGYEINIALAALALSVVLLGSGRYSLDRYFGASLRRRHEKDHSVDGARS